MCYWRVRVLARDSQSLWRKFRLGQHHIHHLLRSPSVNKKRQRRQSECNVWYNTSEKVDRTQIIHISPEISNEATRVPWYCHLYGLILTRQIQYMSCIWLTSYTRLQTEETNSLYCLRTSNWQHRSSNVVTQAWEQLTKPTRWRRTVLESRTLFLKYSQYALFDIIYIDRKNVILANYLSNCISCFMFL